MAGVEKLAVKVLGVPVGTLAPAELPKYVFTYFPDAPSTHFVSLTMPVRDESYVWAEGLHPVFQMNLPEGYQKELISRRLQSTMHVDDFSLLAITGNRGIGRFTVHPIEQNEPDAGGALSIADILPRPDSREALLQALDSLALDSISGVMPKAPVGENAMRKPNPDEKLTAVSRDWILKTGRQDTPGIAINEFLCLGLAKAMGLPVPETRLSEDGEVIAIRRFDRDADGTPLGLEDFCALMGHPPSEKYDASMEDVAKHLYKWCAPSERVQSARRLVEMLLLNLVIRNADAHSKNYSILYSSVNNATLAPVYDVVTISAYPQFAQSPFGLSIGGRRAWNMRKELDRYCSGRLNLPSSAVASALENTAAGMQRLVPEIERYAVAYPNFRETGKRMVKLWEEGLSLMAGKKSTTIKVDFSTPALSAIQKTKKPRKSKTLMNPEKFE